MNSIHVAIIEKAGKTILANPPEVMLVEDPDGSFINWGGVLIRHTPYEYPKIGGKGKSIGYAVEVEVYNSGSHWEPPSTDVSEQGIFSSFVTAIEKAISLHIENEMQCWAESFNLHAEIQNADEGCRRAWADGYKAYKEGKLEQENPHPANSELGILWRQGYDEAEVEQASIE